MDVAGKVVLVTGGASGIGLAVADLLAERGAEVVVADVRTDGDQVAGEHGLGFERLDVRNADDYDSAFAGVVEEHGRLDIVMLNAGVQASTPGVDIGRDGFAWTGDDVVTKLIDINFRGVLNGILATRRLAQRPADIIVTASRAGMTPLTFDPVYAATKHAVLGLVRSVQQQLAEEGTRIQAVCPGGIDTAIVAPDLRQLTTFAPPRYIAEAVAHLLENGSPGDIWMALDEGAPFWKYEYAPVVRTRPTIDGS